MWQPAGRASALLAVADKGPDHAVLATVLIALLQGCVLRGAEARGIGVAIGTAGLVAIDGQGKAAFLGGDHLVAGGAAAFLYCRGLRHGGRLVVVGLAVSRTRPNRERAGGIGRDYAQRQHADGSNSAESGANNMTHGLPPKTWVPSKTKVVNRR